VPQQVKLVCYRCPSCMVQGYGTPKIFRSRRAKSGRQRSESNVRQSRDRRARSVRGRTAWSFSLRSGGRGARSGSQMSEGKFRHSGARGCWRNLRAQLGGWTAMVTKPSNTGIWDATPSGWTVSGFWRQLLHFSKSKYPEVRALVTGRPIKVLHQ